MRRAVQLFALLMVVVLVGAAYAADKPAKIPMLVLDGHIVKIDTDKNEITIRVGKKDEVHTPVVVTVDDKTVITVSKVADKKIGDLKEGMMINVYGEDGKPAAKIVAWVAGPKAPTTKPATAN